MRVAGGRVSISDSLFRGNNNRFEGGALSAENNAAVTLERVAFVDNFLDVQQSGAGSGGAVIVARST